MASILAFSRGIDFTDGAMFSVHAGSDNKDHEVPAAIRRLTIRAIQGQQEQKSTSSGDSVANLQTTEVGHTRADAKALRVRFGMRVHPLAALLHSCNDLNLRQEIAAFLAAVASNSVVAEDLACRYARNILNGRWLWRNRSLGALRVKVAFGDNTVIESAPVSLFFMEPYSAEEQQLGAWIKRVWFGDRPESVVVQGDVTFDIKGTHEIYPSQEKPLFEKGNQTKFLYKLSIPDAEERLRGAIAASKDSGTELGSIEMGQPGLRDAKIGNAIRTIDTWYAQDGEQRPIPLEPNGANLEYLTFMRGKGAMIFNYLEKASVLNKYTSALQANKLSDEQRNTVSYILGAMIRGGVFGSKTKSEDE